MTEGLCREVYDFAKIQCEYENSSARAINDRPYKTTGNVS